MEVELTDEETRSEDTGTAPARPRRFVSLAVIAAVALGLDIATKVTVVAELEGRQDIELLGGLLRLNVIRNPGAAFGLAGSLTIVLSLIVIAVVIFIVRTATRLRSRGWAIALGLILGGALGNLTDRLLRAPGPLTGHVVDWIQLPYWPIFNIADSAVVCGGVLAVVVALRGIGVDGSRATKDNELVPTPAADGGDGVRE